MDEGRHRGRALYKAMFYSDVYTSHPVFGEDNSVCRLRLSGKKRGSTSGIRTRAGCSDSLSQAEKPMEMRVRVSSKD